jgi:hypothetical protein
LWPSAQIYLDDFDIQKAFLGTSVDQIKTANYYRQFIDGNSVPPPDQGFFQGNGAADFLRNMDLLIEVINDKYLKWRWLYCLFSTVLHCSYMYLV